MTTKKLLENLNKGNYLHRQYKVIAKTQSGDARSVFIMQSDSNGYPLHILNYRLDLNYLVNIYSIYATRVYVDELRLFENAVKEVK